MLIAVTLLSPGPSNQWNGSSTRIRMTSATLPRRQTRTESSQLLPQLLILVTEEVVFSSAHALQRLKSVDTSNIFYHIHRTYAQFFSHNARLLESSDVGYRVLHMMSSCALFHISCHIPIPSASSLPSLTALSWKTSDVLRAARLYS